MLLYQPHHRSRIKLIGNSSIQFACLGAGWGEKKTNLKTCTTTSIQGRPVPVLLLKRFCSSQFAVRWIYNEPSVIQLYQSCGSAGSQPHTRSPAQLGFFAFSSFPSFVTGFYSKLMNQSKILHTYLSAFQKRNLHFGNGWKTCIQSGITMLELVLQ